MIWKFFCVEFGELMNCFWSATDSSTCSSVYWKPGGGGEIREVFGLNGIVMEKRKA